jgi:hypothetical protein
MKEFTFKRGGQEYSFTALPGMADDDIKLLIPEYGGGVPVEKIWTAEMMAKQFKAIDVRAWAKERGLKTTGKELDVAQRLLDSGFKPKD